MTVDLRTRYLGLDLRSPIVASAAPHNGEPATAAPPRGGGRRRDRPALAVRGGDPRRGARARPLARAGHRAVRRGARLLPRHRHLRERRRPLPARRSSGSRPTVARPGHRQPQRDARTGGWVRYARRMQDAGADALELNLYHVAADPDRTRRRHRGRRPRPDRGRPRRGHDPARRQAEPVLLVVRELRGRRGRRRRRRRAGPVQPLLPAGPRPRHARGRPAARAEPALGAAAAGPLDRDPAAAAGTGRLARRHLRRPHRRATRSRR